MGTYKVIQDIEAEDKLFGPFTLRQFIYLIIVIVCGFVAFKLMTVKWFLAIPFLPPITFFGLLAAPFGHSQSSEVWLLAKIRFAVKPRKRIWNQSGIKELVTITVPKKIEKQLTKGFSQDEVQSRLKALANTIDTRGWAVKNVKSNMFNQSAYGYADTGGASDRLVNMSYSAATEIEDIAATDVLDEYANPSIQNIDQLMTSAEQAHHQQLVTMMQSASTQQTSPQTTNQQWFTTAAEQQTATPQAQSVTTSVLPQQPLPAQSNPIQQQTIELNPQPVVPSNPVITNPTPTPVTQAPDTAILELANNDDLNITTIARQADKAVTQTDDEVVISLH